MVPLGRRTLTSRRKRTRRIDGFFEHIAYALLFVALLFVVTMWLSKREAVRIEQVTVVGGESIDHETVKMLATEQLGRSYFARIDRNNILLLPRRDLVNAIFSLNARIKSVDISVLEENILSIAIAEYQPAALWCKDIDNAVASSSRNCFHADQHGYIFAQAPEFSGYPFILFRTAIAGEEEEGSPIGLHILNEDEFAKLEILRDLLRKNNIIIHEITADGEGDYTIRTDMPWSIMWSSRRDPTKTAEHLQIALPEITEKMGTGGGTSTPSYVDLRFENKIFYR